jgi:urease accessory protein
MLYDPVLAVNCIIGNIFSDRRLEEKYQRAKAAGSCERLLVSRIEMEKLRLRRTTDVGTDVGLVLEPGSRLRHGDVLGGEKFIVVEQLPEKVAAIRIRKDDPEEMIGLAALVGHIIGNRHRPIAVDHGIVSFPLQSESEAETFKKLLPAGIEMKVTEEIFFSAGESHAHV